MHERAGFRDNVLKTSHIDLVDDKQGGFASEERLDRMEELALFGVSVRFLRKGY